MNEREGVDEVEAKGGEDGLEKNEREREVRVEVEQKRGKKKKAASGRGGDEES